MSSNFESVEVEHTPESLAVQERLETLASKERIRNLELEHERILAERENTFRLESERIAIARKTRDSFFEFLGGPFVAIVAFALIFFIAWLIGYGVETSDKIAVRRPIIVQAIESCTASCRGAMKQATAATCECR